MNALATIAALLMSFCGAHAKQYAAHAIRAAELYGLNPRIIASMMKQESGCLRDAVGRKNEQGLMQVKRNTIATRGYDHLSDTQLRRPALNIRLGARHLRYCLNKCNGDLPGALGMYSGLKKDRATKQCRSSSYSWEILQRAAEP